jgi:hypothetical protein
MTAHAGEIEEFSINEEGCILNLNDPQATEKIRSRML